jgi:hypothetical protein
MMVTLPYSEAAMSLGIAGREMLAVEEDIYMNGHLIPVEKRLGCFVIGAFTYLLLKSEAGWDEDGLRKFMIRSGSERDGYVERVWVTKDKETARKLTALGFPAETVMFVREMVR